MVPPLVTWDCISHRTEKKNIHQAIYLIIGRDHISRVYNKQRKLCYRFSVLSNDILSF